MIWVAWRQFRTQALVTLALLAAFAVLVLVTGLHLRDIYDSLGGAHCGARGDCGALIDQDRALPDILGPTLLVIPALLGMFWGAPLLARELESGTYRLAWTQTVTRRQWLLVRVALVGVAALAVAGVASWLVSWWFAPLDAVNMNRFDPSVFTERGIVAIGYAGFAFALGVAAGALTRRTLTAMAATLLGFIAARIAFTFLIRPHLLPTRASLFPLTLGKSVELLPSASGLSVFAGVPPLANAWAVSATLVDHAHRALSTAQLHDLLLRNCPTVTRPGKGEELTEGAFLSCSRALSRHVQMLVAYQPPSHYWPLQALETAIFLAAALALIGATLWRVGRHATRKPTAGTPLGRTANPRALTIAAIVVALLSLLAASCDGGGSPGVASIPSSTTTATSTTESSALAYSGCMRAHGVPSFPDPAGGGAVTKEAAVRAFREVSNSQVLAAQTACRRLQPNGGQPSRAQLAQRLGDMLAFARCIRMHGIQSFPDPTSSGELTHETLASAGIDVHQPALLRAADACVGVTHGALTKAAVARFVAGH
jgi:ABC-2 family transporter